MTTETLTIEQRMAVMEAALAAAQAENEALRARSDSGDPMLEAALDEFSKDYVQAVPGAHMTGPCQQVTKAGSTCGRPWRDHLPEGRNLASDGRPARIRDHSYRDRPPDPPNEKPKGNLYAREEPQPVAEETLEDTYMSERDAAKALGVKIAEVREMIAARTLRVDRVGGVALVRRESVERVLALAAIVADNPEADDVEAEG